MVGDEDPVDIWLSGFTGAWTVFNISLGLFFAGAITNWIACGQPEGVAGMNEPTQPVAKWLTNHFGALMSFVWLLAFIGVWPAVAYMIRGDLSLKVGFYLIYGFSCILWAPVSIDERWWFLPFILFLTITLYYWFAFPIAIQQHLRRQELRGDFD